MLLPAAAKRFNYCRQSNWPYAETTATVDGKTGVTVTSAKGDVAVTAAGDVALTATQKDIKLNASREGVSVTAGKHPS